jgi:hypothetical protein
MRENHQLGVYSIDALTPSVIMLTIGKHVRSSGGG